jgi:hypothetical protein
MPIAPGRLPADTPEGAAKMHAAEAASMRNMARGLVERHLAKLDEQAAALVA